MTPVTAPAPSAANQPQKGKKGSKGVKVKFVDSKKSTLTIHRSTRTDGAVTVKVVHVKVGDKAKTGMVHTFATGSAQANDAAAQKKIDEIVALAEKAKWVRQISGKAKSTKNEFDAIPAAL